MKPLETSQRVLTWLCMCPASANTTNGQKFTYISSTFIILLGMTGLMTMNAIFFMKFVSICLTEALIAMFQFTGIFGSWYMCIAVLPSRHKIKAIFQRLTAITDENAGKDSFQYLEEANDTSEWIWRNYFKLMIYALISVPIVSGGSVVISYMLRGHYDNNYLYRPLKLSLPWDQRTPLGYMCEICFVIYSSESYILANGSFLLLFISICFYHRAFYKMFKHSIGELADPEKRRNDKELLCQLVQFHNSIKDWFRMTAHLYSQYILVHLICDMILMAGIFFQLDLQVRKVDFNIFSAFQSALVVFPNIFLYCYFGKLATESYERMSHCLYESNWQNLPIELQKYVVLMISNTQQPIYYDGFGVVVLNLQTSTKLTRAVFSYYMTFKAVTE